MGDTDRQTHKRPTDKRQRGRDREAQTDTQRQTVRHRKRYRAYVHPFSSKF